MQVGGFIWGWGTVMKKAIRGAGKRVKCVGLQAMAENPDQKVGVWRRKDTWKEEMKANKRECM